MKISGIKIAATLMCFFSFFLECAADTGCAMNIGTGTETIYATLNGTGTRAGLTYQNYINGIVNDQANPLACPRYDYWSVIVTGGPGSCCINGTCSLSYMLASFNFVACPIDRFSGIYVICSGVLGFCIIRRRQKHDKYNQELNE